MLERNIVPDVPPPYVKLGRLDIYLQIHLKSKKYWKIWPALMTSPVNIYVPIWRCYILGTLNFNQSFTSKITKYSQVK